MVRFPDTLPWSPVPPSASSRRVFANLDPIHSLARILQCAFAMTRPLRFSHPWQPVEITGRTIQGRFLLRPSSRLNALIAGILSLAKERYEVRIYNLVFLSNHFHMIAAAPSPSVLSAFMGFVMGNIAREAGKLYDWPGSFWERRHRTIPIADDESLMGRMRYIFENGCKEGLVSHPSKWPGLNAVDALLHGTTIEGIWVKRTALYNARRTKKKVEEKDHTERRVLKLDPLPTWEGLSPKRMVKAVAELIADAASSFPQGTRAERAEKKRVMAQPPHHRPERVKKGFAPLCHAASKAVADAFREAYRAFVGAYRAAAEKLAKRLPRLGFPTHAQVMAFAVLETG